MDLLNQLCMEGLWMWKRYVSKLFASNSNVCIDKNLVECVPRLDSGHAMSYLWQFSARLPEPSQGMYLHCSQRSSLPTDRFRTRRHAVFFQDDGVCACQRFDVGTLSDHQGRAVPASHQFPGFLPRRAHNILCH